MNFREGKKTSGTLTGTIYSLTAFIIWGLLPGYWKQLQGVPAEEILYHRVLWSFLVSALLVIIAGRAKQFIQILKQRRLRFLIYFTSASIAVNWLTYVCAINTDKIVEASLGYYINPLVNVFLGMVFLKERLTRLQTTALLLAICGVSYLTYSMGGVPWIALVLAFSFGIYGLLKKIGNLDSVTSLTVETMFLSVFALPLIIRMGLNGAGSFGGGSLYRDLILAGSGVVSAVPLYLFASGAKSIPLSRVGFLQYAAPTISLFIGVLLYREPFTYVHAVSFSFIWMALLLYTVSGFIEKK